MQLRAVLILSLVALAAGCGGDAPPPGSLAALQRESIAGTKLELGTTDLGPGRNRVSFLVLDEQLQSVERATARVWIARGLDKAPYAETRARLEPVGVSREPGDALNVYVADVETPEPGTYWVLAEPVDANGVQALGTLRVLPKAVAPSIGDRAVPVVNPTVKAGFDPRTITTARPPDTELLQVSVAQALAARRPFVVTFASPLFCLKRACGPVVDVVRSVAKRWQGKAVDFVHVEVYENNYVPNGHNKWVKAWRLPSDPFTYVVDRRGVIRTKLEGPFSAAELNAAVNAVTSER